MFHRVRIALAALIAAAMAVGQERLAVRESAGVTLVEVPVNVTGRDGKPIAGLTASDFQIEDEGKAQKIVSFDVVDLRQKQVVAGQDTSIPAAARRHFLLLFDLSYSTPLQIVRAREAALRFIATGMDPEDLAAVGTTSEGGARLLVTFTADRRQLVEAIRALGLPAATDRSLDPLSFAFVVPGDPSSRGRSPAIESARPSTGTAGVDPGAARIYAMMAQRSEDLNAITRVARHLGEMNSLASALNLVAGRKTIVYFSEGYDSRLLLGSLARQRSHEETIADNDSILQGRHLEIDIARRSANTPLQRQLDGTVELFRRSDCVVYPIDITGLKADGDASLASVGRGEDSLFALAHATGGELLKSANNLDAQMRRIAEKTSLTYVLTFQPTVRLEPGKFHRLKVGVRTKGARVSARAGYYETRHFGSMTPLERSLSAADVITHEKTGGDFSLEVVALAVRDQPLGRAPVVLEVPGEELLRGATGERLRLGLYVYAVDERGALADFFSRALAVDLKKEGARLRGAALRYAGSLRLLPGAYRVRALVRDEDRGRFAFRAVALEMPEPGGKEMFTLPPLFLGGESSGISLRDASVGETSPDIFELGGEVFVPDLKPRLSAGKVSRLCLMVYPEGNAASGAAFQVEAGIRDAQGRAWAPAQFAVVGRSAPDATGLIKLLLHFAPVPLPPGGYVLSITLKDPSGASPPARTEAAFRIL